MVNVKVIIVAKVAKEAVTVNVKIMNGKRKCYYCSIGKLSTVIV